MSERFRLKTGTRVSTCTPNLSPEVLQAAREQAQRALDEYQAKFAEYQDRPTKPEGDRGRWPIRPVVWCPCCQHCSTLSSFWEYIPKQGTCASCPPHEHAHQDIPTLEEALQTPEWELQSVEISVIVRELKTRIALEGVSERFSVHSFDSWTKTNDEGETVLHVQILSRGPTGTPALDLVGHEVYTLFWEMNGGVLPPAQWPVPPTLARWRRRTQEDATLQHDIELPALLSAPAKVRGKKAAGAAFQKFVTDWGRLLGRPPKPGASA